MSNLSNTNYGNGTMKEASGVFNTIKNNQSSTRTSQKFSLNSVASFNALEWDENGFAKVSGSNLYFQRTADGIKIVSTVETDDGRRFVWSTTADSKNLDNKKSFQDEIRDNKNSSKSAHNQSDSGILCCINCGKYGVSSNFTASGRFCSRQCAGMYAGKRKYLLKDQNPSKAKKVHSELKRDDLPDWHNNSAKDEERPPSNGAISTRLQNRQVVLKKSPKSQMKVKSLAPADKLENRHFDWPNYLAETKSDIVPAECFVNALPPLSKRAFEIGMKLEAVSIRQPDIIIVATIIKIQGYRMLLHPDGWPDDFDFWVSMDSPDIHPVGWCSRNKYPLNPPPHIPDERFNWETYLKAQHAKPALDHLFKLVKPARHSFRIGTKLEAVDRQNPELICVSTISALRGDRFLVHFDGWGESFDYWCDETCPYIHHIGWCEENHKTLIPPNGNI
ncbi:uncharacterized protein TRIADDRAFT_58097 [Trichoplax adhaerens]|uniref:FCS-type domain-containing protein n=1 Tax=Trichoplax adhaerens TaxID=10228 RepID=B3S2P2_TRIAD|nr:hypothetical protein TRIADDRAFT_58097 [Trichoplax adhaerens]EDV23453.1 hypothetical protein TRIADDRAFT_58097 [Trichoplax adhaerens]|eukprot:XP_002114363.1 hypothetical protein TRIADDRAFT_58097 [Trichoplax adhaerens]